MDNLLHKSRKLIPFLLVPFFLGAGLTQDTNLLLHLDGADAATSTTESSKYAHSIAFNGTAQLDTAQYKWGVSSLLVDGNSDYLTSADSSSWDFVGSLVDSWTIDFWVKFTDHSGTEHLINHFEDSSNYWLIRHTDGSGLNIFAESSLAPESGGDYPMFSSVFGGEITDTNWHHVAIIKVADKIGIYKDGSQVTYTVQNYADTFTASLFIGARGTAGSGFFDGWMDEIRIQQSNYFNAAPVVGLTNTITVPTRKYDWAGRID